MYYIVSLLDTCLLVGAASLMISKQQPQKRTLLTSYSLHTAEELATYTSGSPPRQHSPHRIQIDRRDQTTIHIEFSRPNLCANHEESSASECNRSSSGQRAATNTSTSLQHHKSTLHKHRAPRPGPAHWNHFVSMYNYMYLKTYIYTHSNIYLHKVYLLKENNTQNECLVFLTSMQTTRNVCFVFSIQSFCRGYKCWFTVAPAALTIPRSGSNDRNRDRSAI